MTHHSPLIWAPQHRCFGANERVSLCRPSLPSDIRCLFRHLGRVREKPISSLTKVLFTPHLHPLLPLKPPSSHLPSSLQFWIFLLYHYHLHNLSPCLSQRRSRRPRANSKSLMDCAFHSLSSLPLLHRFLGPQRWPCKGVTDLVNVASSTMNGSRVSMARPSRPLIPPPKRSSAPYTRLPRRTWTLLWPRHERLLRENGDTRLSPSSEASS